MGYDHTAILAYINSSKTGIYTPLGLQTRGGNVGIGTTAPGYNLQVLNSGAAASFGFGNTAAGKTSMYGGTSADTNGFSYIQSIKSSGSAWGDLILNGSGGNVGIGTTSPEAMLNVNGGIRSGTAAQGYHGDFQQSSNDTNITANGDVDFRAGNTNDGSGNVVFKTALGTAVGGTNTNVERMRITAQGRVGIGTSTPDTMLTVNGGADKPGGGSWGTYSDGRLKDVQGTFDYGLNEVLGLQPIFYRYKADNALGLPSEEIYSGFIAQDVAKLIPEAVEMNSKGYYKLNQDPILWTMLNAIKQEHAQRDAENARLKAENRLKDEAISQLQTRVGKAETDAAQLKAFLCSRFADASMCQP